MTEYGYTDDSLEILWGNLLGKGKESAEFKITVRHRSFSNQHSLTIVFVYQWMTTAKFVWANFMIYSNLIITSDTDENTQHTPEKHSGF